MATTMDNSKKSAIINLSEEIKRSKAKGKEGDLSKDIVELQSLIETLKKEREKNTVTAKYMQRMTAKLDKASNPSTYLRAVMPKFFETFHQNLDTYDKERKAQKEIEKLQAENRKKEIKELTSSLDEFIKGSENLKEISNRFGKDAARREALVREELAATQKADKEYAKNMETITDRLNAINDDARAEWAKQKGIQLVKIVEDEPSKEALNDIKNELSKQIEADANKYEQEKILAKKTATDDRRNKEAMLKEQSWFRKFFSTKKEDKKDGGNSLLSQLLGAWAIENLIPALIKAGLVAGLIAGIVEYFSNPEFQKKVDDLIEAINVNIIQPMFEQLKPKLELAWENFKTWLFEKMKAHWEWVLAGLALAFPVATFLLVKTALTGLVNAIWWAVKKIYEATGGPSIPGGVDTPDKPNKGDKGGNSPEKKRERSKNQPRDKNGRFTKRPAAGAPKGGMGGRLGGPLALLSIFGVDAILDYDDDRVWAAMQELDTAPFLDDISEDEEDKYYELIEKKKFSEASDYLNDELANKYGYKRDKNFLGMRYKEWQKVTPTNVKPKPISVGPSGPLTLPQEQTNPFFATQMGFQQPSIMNAPTVNNRTSNTTLMTNKTAVDPSRSIMFQNRP